MSKIKEILRKKEERRVKLQRSLNSILQRLKNTGAQKIILFGSLASGNVDVNSDLDLFVLMPSAKTGKEWTDIIYSTMIFFSRGYETDRAVVERWWIPSQGLESTRHLCNIYHWVDKDR